MPASVARAGRPVALALVVASLIAMSAPAASAGPRIIEQDEGSSSPAQGTGEDIEAAHVPETASGLELLVRGGLLYNGNRDFLADEVLYGGVDGALRWRLIDVFSVSLGLGLHARHAEAAPLRETRVSFDLGFALYPVMGEVFELYVVFGAAVGGGTVSHEVGDRVTGGEYTEVGGYVGLGSDVRFGDVFVNTELRIPMLARTDTSPAPDPARDYRHEADDFRSMLGWSLGVGYRF